MSSITYDRSPANGVTVYHNRQAVLGMADEMSLRTFLSNVAAFWSHARVPTPDGMVRLTEAQAADLTELCAMHLRQLVSQRKAEA